MVPGSLDFYSFRDRRLVLKHGRYSEQTSLDGLADQLASLYLHQLVGERIHQLGWLAAGVGSYLSAFREEHGAFVLGAPRDSLRERLAGEVETEGQILARLAARDVASVLGDEP